MQKSAVLICASMDLLPQPWPLASKSTVTQAYFIFSNTGPRTRTISLTPKRDSCTAVYSDIVFRRSSVQIPLTTISSVFYRTTVDICGTHFTSRPFKTGHLVPEKWLLPYCNSRSKIMCYMNKKHTRAAPKVMSPIYFHGNYNRYKEHNNTIW